MKKPKKQKKSMMTLARKIGVSRSTLYDWKTAGAPIEKGEGAVLQWALAENRRGSDSDEMRAAKLGVLRETERRLKLANDARSKATINLEEVEYQCAQTMSLIQQALQKAFGYDLPQVLVGCDIHEIASRLNSQLYRLEDVLRLEFRKVVGKEINPADFKALILSAEANEVFRVIHQRANEEKVSREWHDFMEWKRKVEEERLAARRAWCRERAAAGLAVPDATDEELIQHPGLKRR